MILLKKKQITVILTNPNPLITHVHIACLLPVCVCGEWGGVYCAVRSVLSIDMAAFYWLATRQANKEPGHLEMSRLSRWATPGLVVDLPPCLCLMFAWLAGSPLWSKERNEAITVQAGVSLVLQCRPPAGLPPPVIFWMDNSKSNIVVLLNSRFVIKYCAKYINKCAELSPPDLVKLTFFHLLIVLWHLFFKIGYLFTHVIYSVFIDNI